jgi:O-antigen ligase
LLRITDAKTKLFYFGIIFLLFIDIPIISLSGANIRLAYLVLPMLAALKIKPAIEKRSFILLAVFVFTSLPSLFFSGDVLKSILYYVWIAISYYSIYLVFNHYAKYDFKNIFNAYLNVTRFYIVFSILLVIAGVHDRAKGLFYEPSYLVIALIPFFVNLFYSYSTAAKKITLNYILDWVLFLAIIYYTKSATALIIVSIIMLSLVFNKFKFANLIKLAISLVILYYAVTLYAKYSSDLLGVTLKDILENISNFFNLVTYLTGRAGNRFPRLDLAWDVFMSHPLFGVGIGAYESYISNINTYSYFEFENINNLPAVNIYIEFLATVGIVGAIPLILFFLKDTIKIFKVDRNSIQFVALISLIVMLLDLNMEANYLRPYLWCLLGICAGVSTKNTSNLTKLTQLSHSKIPPKNENTTVS